MTAIGEMRSLPDGEHYTAMNADKSMIIKYSYRTGNPVDTLFNARKARECTFTDFDGYTISSTGHHILVWRDTESIYRRSTKAVYGIIIFGYVSLILIPRYKLPRTVS